MELNNAIYIELNNAIYSTLNLPLQSIFSGVAVKEVDSVDDSGKNDVDDVTNNLVVTKNAVAFVGDVTGSESDEVPEAETKKVDDVTDEFDTIEKVVSFDIFVFNVDESANSAADVNDDVVSGNITDDDIAVEFTVVVD